jgi:hypothetical protein
MGIQMRKKKNITPMSEGVALNDPHQRLGRCSRLVKKKGSVKGKENVKEMGGVGMAPACDPGHWICQGNVTPTNNPLGNQLRQ